MFIWPPSVAASSPSTPSVPYMSFVLRLFVTPTTPIAAAEVAPMASPLPRLVTDRHGCFAVQRLTTTLGGLASLDAATRRAPAPVRTSATAPENSAAATRRERKSWVM